MVSKGGKGEELVLARFVNHFAKEGITKYNTNDMIHLDNYLTRTYLTYLEYHHHDSLRGGRG